MKTSFKILIPTIFIMFALMFAIYFNVKAEMNKYVTKEYDVEKQEIADFNNIVLKTNATLTLVLSDKNEVYGNNINLSDYKLENNTLYIYDTSDVRIGFTNVKNLSSEFDNRIYIDSISTDSFSINCRNATDIKILKGEIKNLKVNLDSGKVFLRNIVSVENIMGNIKNNSSISFTAKIESIKLNSDTSSTINTYRWR